MQDVTITFTGGLLKGRIFDFEVGRVPIGRAPGEGGLELKGADASVSRLHAELVEDGGDILLNNRSSNGTTVDGKMVLDSTQLESGALIEIGDMHPFTVHWSSVGVTQVIAPSGRAKKKAAPGKPGPLSSPIVRAVIGVYLIGLIGLGVWLRLDSAGDATGDDWPALAAEYADYRGAGQGDDTRQARAARAEALVRQLRAMRIQGIGDRAQPLCRELMSLDGDPKSPLFQYGARCLGVAQESPQ